MDNGSAQVSYHDIDIAAVLADMARAGAEIVSSDGLVLD